MSPPSEKAFVSEYQYGKPYLPAIQGLDENDQVIYVYSFWRVLYPLVKTSVLVLPRRLVSVVRRAQQFLGGVSLTEQKNLADFIVAGHYERHMYRMHSVYESRRAALIQALTEHFGSLLISSSGLHLVVRFPTQYPAAAITSCGAESGLSITDTASDYISSEPRPNEFIIDFASHSDQSSMQNAVDQFSRKLEQYR